MPKTTKFSELRAQMSPEARAEARRLADEDLKEMPLHELRAARHLTQQQLAKSLDMTQAAVSQLEQRTDVYLSTLENFVEAMGGRLEMYAVFPDGKVKLGLEREAIVGIQPGNGPGPLALAEDRPYEETNCCLLQQTTITTAGNRAREARACANPDVESWSPNGVQTPKKCPPWRPPASKSPSAKSFFSGGCL
jgi:transcriptional regulator with XRE-family HTH domain